MTETNVQQEAVKTKPPTPDELIQQMAARVSDADRELVASLTKPNEKWRAIAVTVGPAAAALILRDHNGANRGFKPKHKEFAHIMKRGGWQLTKETLAFDTTGRLRDGQNRLLACIVADTEIRVGVQLGESVDAAVTYDGGQPRTAGDILHMGGTTDAALRSIVVKRAVNYEHRLKTGKARSLDRGEVVEHAERHASTLAIAIGLGRRSLEKPGDQAASWQPCLKEAEASTVAFLALNGGWTAPVIGSFLSALQIGKGEGENHPIERAAYILVTDQRNKAKPGLKANQRLSLAFQALPLWATNTRRRLNPGAKQLASFERPEDVPADLLGDGMPLAPGSERGDH